MRYMVVSDGDKPLAVMINRDIYNEGIWKQGELNMQGEKGIALYPIDQLIGYDDFNALYGFKLSIDTQGIVRQVVDLETNSPICSNSMNNIDVKQHPELMAYLPFN